MTSDGRADRTHDRRCYALILLATFAGPRRGEATALSRCDLDLDAHVRVRPAYAERSTGEMLHGPPKSKAGRRIANPPTRSVRHYVSTCRSLSKTTTARGQPTVSPPCGDPPTGGRSARYVRRKPPWRRSRSSSRTADIVRHVQVGSILSVRGQGSLCGRLRRRGRPVVDLMLQSRRWRVHQSRCRACEPTIRPVHSARCVARPDERTAGPAL
jgi:hypothetical protein